MKENRGRIVEDLSLSTRCCNCLHKNNIHTIDDLIKYNKDDFKNMKNIGKKSLEEIFQIIDVLKKENGIEVSENDNKNIQSNDLNNNFFIHKDGNLYEDVKLDKLNFSTRSYNCLKLSGYKLLSEIIKLKNNDIFAIKKAGAKTYREILDFKKNYILKIANIDNDEEKEYLNNFFIIFKSFEKVMDLDATKLYNSMRKVLPEIINENLTIKNAFLLNNRKVQRTILKLPYLNEIFGNYIQKLLKKNKNGSSIVFIYESSPLLFKDFDFIFQIVEELLKENKIIEKNKGIYFSNLNSFQNNLKDILKEKSYKIFNDRIMGLNSAKIGEKYNISRTAISNILNKISKEIKSLKFIEDENFSFMSHYDVKAEEFEKIFGDMKIYNYLKIKSLSEKNLLTQKLPIYKIPEDYSIEKEIRDKFSTFLKSKYIRIENEYRPCNRTEILKYVTKTFAKNDCSIKFIKEKYKETLKILGLENVEKLDISDRYLESKVASSKLCLWKFGKNLRYYNFEAYDFDELIKKINLEQYDDVEFSTLKFVNLYPRLMEDYNIKDEYELHNLLKKIYDDKNKKIFFSRMPNIEIGNANRGKQIYDLLNNLSPISKNDFAKEYENEYGTSASTLLWNYMRDFEMYFANGFYNLEVQEPSFELMEKMREELLDNFYWTIELKEIYKKINKYNDIDLSSYAIKKLGFKIYNNYVIKNTFDTATDFFKYLITKNEVYDLDLIPGKIRQILTYSTTLNKLKSNYEIIEFLPNKIINFSKLEGSGITLQLIYDFLEKVEIFSCNYQYFTIDSIIDDGFDHELFEYGFDNYFYTSILTEFEKFKNSQKVGGNKIFAKSENKPSFEKLIEYLVSKQPKLFIEVYDLQKILKSIYNINVTNYKLIEVVKNTEMYYDTISEKIYIDYDIYYEEI